ncbi:MAG: winged helix-turn-helix domain-containing protein, partial [Psychrosphaera sp.]|nr:winged helix-turn-helix domain-containing protein [Psychrosphaera sp.]
MNSPKQTHYQIGDWLVDFSSNVISKDNTEVKAEVKIEAKTMAVLKYLVEHANQTVTRDELLDEVWSDMVTVQDVVTNAVGKLRKALGDNKKQIIVTVPKVGYKLNAQVSKIISQAPVVTEIATEIVTETVEQPLIAKQQQSQNSHLNKGLLLASIAVLLLLAVYLVISKGDKVSDATLTRIAVMPMKNLGDPSTEYFSEGLADSIRAQLTRLPKLQVIAKTSVVGFAKEEDVKSIGEQLDIGYVITGGVRKTNEEVTINLQLINLDSDTLEWSDSFIGTVDDAFRFQKAIAQSIANALRLKLDPPKVALAEPTAKARQFLQLGQYYRYKRTTDDYYHTSFDVAIDYYHKAIAESPDYAEAYAE